MEMAIQFRYNSMDMAARLPLSCNLVQYTTSAQPCQPRIRVFLFNKHKGLLVFP